MPVQILIDTAESRQFVYIWEPLNFAPFYLIRKAPQLIKEKEEDKEDDKEKDKEKRKKKVTANVMDKVKDRVKDELDEILETRKQVQEVKSKCDPKELQDIRKKFKQACEKTKRETEKLDAEKSMKRAKAGRTRSGANRLATKRPLYTNGKIINKGVDDSQEEFRPEELDFLKGGVKKVKDVASLKYEHLKYLVINVFLDDLKAIKEGKLSSYYHDKYNNLVGKGKSELCSEIRTSLFKNEQRDYIHGLLQGAFHTTIKEDNEDIKHSDINYVEIVMLAEVTIRIVKFVHNLNTIEETMAFMKKSSREALGIDDE